MRITNEQLELRVKLVQNTLEKTNRSISLGGDICGVALYLVKRKTEGSGQLRTLLYGATKKEASLFLDGFLDIVGYSNARVLKKIDTTASR